MNEATLHAILLGMEPTPASTSPLPCAACNTSVEPPNKGSSRFLSRLALDACAKAERARQRWQNARRTGDWTAAERARRFMLRHRALACHLAQGMKNEPA